MADVKYDFAADVTAATRALASLEAKVEKLENANKQLHRSSKKGNDEAVGGMQKQIGALGSLVAGYFSVGAAVNVASRAYEVWAKKLQDATDAAEKFNKSLLLTLAGTGDLARGPEVRQFIESIPGITRGQGEIAFGAIAAAGPELDLERRKRLTREIAPLARVLAPVDLESGEVKEGDAFKQIAAIQARLDVLSGGKLDAGAVTDMAVEVSQDLGGRANDLLGKEAQRLLDELQGTGMTFTRSLAVFTEASQEGVESGGLSSALSQLQKMGLTLDQALNDPTVMAKLPDEARRALGHLQLADINRNEAQLLAADRRDARDQFIRDADRFDPVSALEQQNAVRKDILGAGRGRRERAEEALVEQQYLDEGQPNIPGYRWGIRRRRDFNETFGNEQLTPEQQVEREVLGKEVLHESQRTNTLLESIDRKLDAPARQPTRVNRGAHVENQLMNWQGG